MSRESLHLQVISFPTTSPVGRTPNYLSLRKVIAIVQSYKFTST